MSTLRTDNIQTTDSSFNIAVKSLSGNTKSLIDFGASASDSDHTMAFQNAWASGGTVTIPDGVWRVTSLVGSLTTASTVQFKGSPNAKVILSGTGGFAVTGQGWGFDGFSIVPQGVVPFAIKSGTVGNNHKWSIRNMKFYSEVNSGSYFSCVVDLYNAWYGNFSDNFLRNGGDIDFNVAFPQGIGLRFNYSVNNTISTNTIGGCESGVTVSALAGPNGNVCEGLMFSTNIILCNKNHVKILDGLLINGVNNVLDIPIAGDYPFQIAASCSSWSDNWFNVGVLPVLFGAGQRNTFTSNSFIAAPGAGTLLTTAPGVVTAYNRLALNQFFGGLSAFSLSEGSHHWDISENTIILPTSQSYDTTAGVNIRLRANRVENPVPKLISATTYIEPLIHAVSATVTLPSVAVNNGATITVPISNSPYINAPDYANLTTDGSAQVIVRYIKGSSTKDSLVFSVVAVGTSITAGNYNVFVESKSVTDAY